MLLFIKHYVTKKIATNIIYTIETKKENWKNLNEVFVIRALHIFSHIFTQFQNLSYILQVVFP